MTYKLLKVFVDTEEGERCILVTDYTYAPGLPGVTNRAPEDCIPPEGPSVEDVECKWEVSGDRLDDEEYAKYEDIIIDAIIEANSGGPNG